MVFSHLIYWNYPTPLLLLWLNPHELPFIFSTLVRKQFFHHLLNWSQSSPNSPHFPFIFNLQPSAPSSPSSPTNQPELSFSSLQQPHRPLTSFFFLLHTINTVEPRKQPRSFLAFSSPATPTQRKKNHLTHFPPQILHSLTFPLYPHYTQNSHHTGHDPSPSSQTIFSR